MQVRATFTRNSNQRNYQTFCKTFGHNIMFIFRSTCCCWTLTTYCDCLFLENLVICFSSEAQNILSWAVNYVVQLDELSKKVCLFTGKPSTINNLPSFYLCFNKLWDIYIQQNMLKQSTTIAFGYFCMAWYADKNSTKEVFSRPNL